MSARRVLALAIVVAGGAIADIGAASAADARKGQQLFITYGCYGCHGYNGQGANTGPKLAPDPMAADALAAYIRNASSTLMPPYAEKSVSNADVADMHAWLASQPKVDAKSIPLLKD